MKVLERMPSRNCLTTKWYRSWHMVRKFGTHTQNSQRLILLTHYSEIVQTANNHMGTPTLNFVDRFFRRAQQIYKNTGSGRIGQVSYLIELSWPSNCVLGVCYNIWRWLVYQREIYSDMIEHQYTDRDPWLSFIKIIFQGLGMTHVWDNQFTFSADRLKRAVLS